MHHRNAILRHMWHWCFRRSKPGMRDEHLLLAQRSPRGGIFETNSEFIGTRSSFADNIPSWQQLHWPLKFSSILYNNPNSNHAWYEIYCVLSNNPNSTHAWYELNSICLCGMLKLPDKRVLTFLRGNLVCFCSRHTLELCQVYQSWKLASAVVDQACLYNWTRSYNLSILTLVSFINHYTGVSSYWHSLHLSSRLSSIIKASYTTLTFIFAKQHDNIYIMHI